MNGRLNGLEGKKGRNGHKEHKRLEGHTETIAVSARKPVLCNLWSAQAILALSMLYVGKAGRQECLL